MPWHLSKSDPRKVYDERHEVVCVCQTPEQAARIVAAVTGKTTIVLREPATGERDEPEKFIPADGTSRIAPLDTFEPDYSCCGRRIAKAARTGTLAAVTSWECPDCGCEWRPQIAGTVRHWSPVPRVLILKGTP